MAFSSVVIFIFNFLLNALFLVIEHLLLKHIEKKIGFTVIQFTPLLKNNLDQVKSNRTNLLQLGDFKEELNKSLQRIESKRIVLA